jgi:ferredoxin-NADP reductase
LDISSAGGQRVIFSTGEVHGLVPAQHRDADKTTGRVDFHAGTIAIDNGTQVRARIIAGVIYFVVLLVWCGIGFTLFYRQVLVSVLQRQLFTAGTVVMYFVLQAMLFGAWYADSKASGQRAATSRAFGGITAIGLMWILYPVPKHFGPAILVGSSYAQAVSYHMLFATMELLIMTAHFAAMSVQYLDSSSDAVSVSSRYANKPLFGFLAWLLMLFQIIFAMTFARVAEVLRVSRGTHAVDCDHRVRRASQRHRRASRFGHPAGHVHRRPCAPSRVVVPHQRDRCRRHRSRRRGRDPRASAAGAEHHLSPSRHSSACSPSGMTLVPHPFSIAWYDPKTRIAEVFVKANQQGSFTRQLLEKALAGKLVGVPATATGFHGELQVPLSRVERVLLVAGGIGITPLLSILCAASLQGAAPRCAEFRLVWVVRTHDVVRVMTPHLAWARSVLQQRLVMQIYVTRGAEELSSSAAPTPTELGPESFLEGRPAAADVVANSFKDFSGPVGVYTCGPEGLMDDVAAGVARRGKATFLHTETFAL